MDQCFHGHKINHDDCVVTWTGRGRRGHGELSDATAGSTLHGWANNYYVTTNSLIGHLFPVPFVIGFELVLPMLLSLAEILLRDMWLALTMRWARARRSR